MINHYPYSSLGYADYGWLRTRHHFSFARYYNADRMSFGALRVINDDVIKAGAGFDTHPHKNMEIITFVTAGAITHHDSQGNRGRTVAGDVQVMSTGTGVFHSEFNLENVDTRFFQIWIEPDKKEVTPSWDSYEFPKKPNNKALTLLVAGDGSAPLSIHQDAFIYAGNLVNGSELTHAIKHQAYIVVFEGSLKLNGHLLKPGDGAEVTALSDVQLSALSDCKLLLIDVPNTQQR